MDYKDSKWITPTQDGVEATGKGNAKDSEGGALPFTASRDLGDGEVRVLSRMPPRF